MTHLPIISGKKLVKALSKIGFKFVDQESSHIKLRRKYKDIVQTVIIPDHKEIRSGTLRNILRMANLSVNNLQQLLKK